MTNWTAAEIDLQVVRLRRVNALLVGDDRAIQAAVQMLTPTLRGPITTRARGTALVLPSLSTTGTFIVRDVDELTPGDQRRFFDWSERAAGRSQIISTSREPLLRYVKAGLFLDTLYYRLNTICWDYRPAPDSSDIA
jgi:hypothetical protein